MRIAYCEDEPAQAALVRALMERWGVRRQEPVEVVLFESAEEFMFKNEDFPYDAVFLDIAMRQMNGMELAHAIRYLLKPITAEKLESLLDELLSEREKRSEETVCITVGENGIMKRIAEEDICYVEVVGHYTHLHLAGAAAIRIKESLAAVVARFHSKEQFVKCHRSYVVNLAYVEKISRTDCTLADNTVLPVSRSAYQCLNERFITYYKGSCP